MRFLFFILTMMISYCMKSQNLQRLYGTSNNDVFSSIILLPDGDYIISGTSYLPGGSKVYVARIGPAGNIVWENLYGGSGAEIAYSSITNTNGNIVIGATSNSFNSGGPLDILLFEIDHSGTVQWGRNYGTALEDGLKNITLTSSGIGVCATNGPVGTNNHSMLVFEVSNDGSVINWQNSLRENGGSGNIPSKLISSKTGGYLLVGGSYLSSKLYDQVVIRLSATGVLNNPAVSFGGNNNETCMGVIESADNSIILMGYFRALSGVAMETSLSSLKADLTELNWVRTYGDNSNIDDRTFNIIALESGGYAMAGYKTSSNDAILLITDESGQLQTSSSFGFTAIDVANDLIQNPDGGFTLVGYSSALGAGGNDGYIIKTNSAGTITNSCSDYSVIQRTLTPALSNRTYNGTNPSLSNSAVTLSKNVVNFAINNYPCSQPITLLDFTGKSFLHETILHWSTSIEINNDWFIIEKSTNAEDWITIGTIKGAGNSSSVKEYSFTDFATENGGMYYRLKQVDFDGTYSYSKIIIPVEKRNPTVDALIYPNPAENHLHFYFNKDNLSSIISIHNANGQLVYSQEAETNEVMIDVRHFPRGIYLASITTPFGERHNSRIILK